MNAGTGGWLRRRVLPVLVAQLRQGMTPEQIALTVALAAVISIFPIFGAATGLCALVAMLLRLNQPLIQLANYLMTPLQLALLLPFYRAGETLFGQPHVPIFSVDELVQRFHAGPLQFFADYGKVGLYGVAVWLLVAPLLVLLLYALLKPLLRRLARRVWRQPLQAAAIGRGRP